MIATRFFFSQGRYSNAIARHGYSDVFFFLSARDFFTRRHFSGIPLSIFLPPTLLRDPDGIASLSSFFPRALCVFPFVSQSLVIGPVMTDGPSSNQEVPRPCAASDLFS